MKAKNKRGFTLIELLVVIAIIGILASVVLASLNTAREKSRDAKRISDVKQLQLALELYFDSSTTGYPVSDATWVADLTPTYIPVMPTPPTGTGATAYSYTGLNSGCTSYHLGIVLEATDHTALGGDVDATADAAAKTACGGGGTADFDGSNDAANGYYDLKP